MDDRISKLSDDVLCHILSFLPTEQAIATSVLSKRLRSLWSSVPILNLDPESYLINDKPSSSFHKLVYATILARCANQPIRRFRLKCLVLGPRCSIFSCSTLVDLKLIKVDFGAFSSVHLPSLKILHLDEVIMLEPRYLMELLRGCPILEDLKAIELDCYISPADPFPDGEFKLCFPKLMRADIEECCLETSSIPLKAIRNVEVLRIDKYVEYPNDIPLFPNLTHLELVFGRDIYWHGHLKWDYVLAMIKQSLTLQVLVLKMMRSPHDVVWPFPEFCSGMPIFTA
ncbi:Leucine-rich repeat domain superfamily [Sesbania bispinosa]|nr:Leucine-rich repeat domain superfamily [Sesbania bispinosa]